LDQGSLRGVLRRSNPLVFTGDCPDVRDAVKAALRRFAPRNNFVSQNIPVPPLDFLEPLMHIDDGIWCPDSSKSWIGVSPVGTQARFGGLVAFMETLLARTVVLLRIDLRFKHIERRISPFRIQNIPRNGIRDQVGQLNAVTSSDFDLNAMF